MKKPSTDVVVITSAIFWTIVLTGLVLSLS